MTLNREQIEEWRSRLCADYASEVDEADRGQLREEINTLCDLALLPEGDHDGGKAIIANAEIIIRVPIATLPTVVEGAWALHALDKRFKLTDAALFAKDLVRALNDEDEQGTTMIHKMFDKAILEALEQGAEGIEEHEEQEA